MSIDLGKVHPPTDPVEVEGAAPGDVLEVEALKRRDSRQSQPIAFGPGRLLPPECQELSPTLRRATMTRPPAGEDWRPHAACRSVDPELFFPISSIGASLEQVAAAKAICARCPVRPECLAFALRTAQIHGIWGGLTEQERYPRP